MLEIIKEILNLIDDLNEEVDRISKYPMSSTGVRATTIKRIRKGLRELAVNVETAREKEIENAR